MDCTNNTQIQKHFTQTLGNTENIIICLRGSETVNADKHGPRF